MQDILKILIFSFSSFLTLFIVAKILGKKQIAELDFTDYVVGISIGSIAANWATETEQPWYHFLIAMIIFGFLSFIITFLAQRFGALKSFLRGRPIIVIDKGNFVFKNIKKAKLDIHDILGMCRSQGYFKMEDVDYAIFETSGELSILPKGRSKNATVADLIKVELQENNLEIYVIIDGKPNADMLKYLNKDTKWLLEKIKITKKKQLKDIALAVYDPKKDKVIIYRKK